ncbi:MAG: DUF1015 domain-containing protein [Planctomycetes bacterium]|nr:DUF1015 domain-containing protein [Planctomycetota bacterium]
MPEIAPFRALRYDTKRFSTDVSKLIAPPYDVLEAADKADLLAKSDKNIVAVDLPHMPPKKAGPDALYVQAADLFNRWKSEGTLVMDETPALYIYHQVYEHGGCSYTRKKFFARMRIEAFGEGTVFPHEQTFGGPKEDRFKLMRATQCQMSPIFGLYNDPENAISKLLDPGSRPPDMTADMQGVDNRLWVLQDPTSIDAVCKAFSGRAVYIADGHHRYGTALNYRDTLLKEKGDLPNDHPARFVLVGLCAMEDPGCIILPTHRTVSGFGYLKVDDILTVLGDGMELCKVDADPADAERLLTPDSPHDVALYVPSGERVFLGTFLRRELLAQLAPDRSDPWRKSDLAYLHRCLIEELITARAMGGAEPTVHYFKITQAALDDARQTGGIAFITKACTMDELRAVSHAGDLMPQKSTFFYPKLATGLVINPLA